MSLANTFDEINDYYSIADAAELTLQDGDWCVGIWCRLDDNSGTLFQYFISNNNLGANDSINFYWRESGNGTNPNAMAVDAQDSDGTNINITSATAPGADSKWRLIFMQRDTGAAAGQEFQLWFCEEGQVATLEAVASDAAFNAVNGGAWSIGRRADGDANRYFGGSLAWFFKGDFALSQTEIESMGNGLPPFTLAKKGSYTLDVCIKLHESAATLIDLTGNGNTATRNGGPVVAVTEPLVMSPVKRRRV